MRTNNDEMIDTGEFAKLAPDQAAVEMYHAIHQLHLATKGIPYLVRKEQEQRQSVVKSIIIKALSYIVGIIKTDL